MYNNVQRSYDTLVCKCSEELSVAAELQVRQVLAEMVALAMHLL